MKDLKTYILEANKDTFSELEKITEWVIDYLYNEGIVDYDDKHLVDYVDGEKDPDYKDILNVMLNEYSDDLSSQTKTIINNFIKDKHSKDDDEDIKIHVLRGISNFVEKGNCRKFC